MAEGEWPGYSGGLISARLIGRFEVDDYDFWAEWKNPGTNEIHVFHQNEWHPFDLTPHVAGVKNVTVLIDPDNPRPDWMDTGFLPK